MCLAISTYKNIVSGLWLFLTTLSSYRSNPETRPNIDPLAIGRPDLRTPDTPNNSPSCHIGNTAAMDFLKSAIGSAIAKGGGLPFSLGDRVDIGDSVWALHNGTKRVRWLFGSFSMRHELQRLTMSWHI